MENSIVTKAEPVVGLTEGAAAHLKSLLDGQAEHAGKGLRVFIEGGGCSGFQYGMTFDERRLDDLACESHGVTVLVDPSSAEYLRGAVIDFSKALMDGGFKISNPNVRRSCGCGKSFSTEAPDGHSAQPQGTCCPA
jgi:iron-sulfur cluster assembly accessory protein